MHRSLRISLFVTALFLPLVGCETKRTWAHWMAGHTAVQGDRQVHPAPAIPPGGPPRMLAQPYRPGNGAAAGAGFDLAARHPGFPETYIDTISIDVTHGQAQIEIVWTGPESHLGPMGPWPVSVGRGNRGLDCNDTAQSNTTDSRCTPKGIFPVAGFADHLNTVPECRYATWVVHAPRYIAIHSHGELPDYAASSGCIRTPFEAAKLIHNNSRVSTTRVHIHGEWVSPGPLVQGE